MAVAPTYASGLEAGASYHIPGNYKEVIFTGTVGASDTYAAGGFAFTASTLGLNVLYYVANITFSTGHWGIYDSANGKIKVFKAAATELDDTSAALQNATFVVKALGK